MRLTIRPERPSGPYFIDKSPLSRGPYQPILEA
jgi:hypothetical protein